MASSQEILVLQLTVVALIVLSPSTATAAAPTTAAMTDLGCANTACGGVEIPYPFGTKTGCYLSEDFFINCSNSQPYLQKGTNITLLNVTLETGELRIAQPITRDCYNQTGQPLENNTKPVLNLDKFTVSDTKNKFIAIGCDTRATVQVSGISNNYFVTTGCISACQTRGYIPDGNCSGIGCCETAIPKGAEVTNIVLDSYTNHRKVFDFNPCSYAFVAEEGAFNFSRSYLGGFSEETMPMVIDWSITGSTCEEAKSNLTGYACGGNSSCYEPENGPGPAGYICKCWQGYQGNSYLSDGCQDIDECKYPSLNTCVPKSKCINIPGNYTCHCPKGYHGNGRTDGNGCIADRFLVIQIVIGFAVGGTVVLLSSSWLYWIFTKRKLIKLKEKFFRQNGGLMLQQKLARQERSTQEVIKIFTSEELKAATDDYHESRIIGKGGNGTVYKGILADDDERKTVVAVKKSNKMVDVDQIEQFINEVVVLSQINHRNVVRLLGCCLETQVPLLVYEFITNGTLSDHIHDESKAPISWENRLQIAAETAGVLSYLHSAATVPIIHRDVKSTNILLDDNYVTKVADFGTSRLVPLDHDQVATVVLGTFGYLDPEYFHTSQFTEKSDVYSFGVVLAELITGRKASPP